MAEIPFYAELVRTQEAHWEICRKEFAKLDLTEGMPRILDNLLNHEGCVQKQLAQVCRIKESSLTVLLRKMETVGYVRKEKVVLGNRKSAYTIYLTDSGKQKAEDVHKMMMHLDAVCVEGFTPEEQETLHVMLAKVRENLQKL